MRRIASGCRVSSQHCQRVQRFCALILPNKVQVALRPGICVCVANGFSQVPKSRGVLTAQAFAEIIRGALLP